MDEKKPSSGTTDLTTGRPLWRILVFALPLVLGTVFQQLYSFADTVIVGRCLGTDALAAVGSTYSLNFLILGFIQGACVGFGIPVAEAFGAKNRGDLHRYLANGAWLCVAVSVVFTILTTLLAAPLLIGCDMAQMDDFTRSLLTNDEVIDVNQDPLGLQAVPVWQQGDQVIYQAPRRRLDGRRAFQPGLADREDELHAPHAGSAREADRARPVAAEGPHGVHRQVRNRRCASRRRSGESLPRQQPRTGDRQIAQPVS